LRIAFISPNREHMPDPVVPLGLLYMMSAAGAEHDRILIDVCFEEEPFAFMGRRLDEFLPDLIAVGMRNIQNADYSDSEAVLSYYDQVLRTIREHSAAPVVMGGGGFSVLPLELMRRFDLEYGVIGEGERAFAQLVSRLAAGDDETRDIPGLLSRNTGSPPAAPRAFLDLRETLVPDRRFVDPRYFEFSGISSIQTKRGCSMKCDYCTYPAIEGRRIRRRAAEAVADEWQDMLAAHPAVDHVFIVDAVFNLPAAHARAVSESLIVRGLDRPWSCYLNPLQFDQELADVMARAGCSGVEIGSDSGTDAGLARLHKGFTTDDILRASRLCRNAGLKDCHSFVLGTRRETLGDVERSLDFIEALDPHSAIIMAYKDDREAVDEELSARMGEFRARVLDTVSRRAAAHAHWSVPSIGLRFNSRLFALLRQSGLRGPLWQHAR
jgi:radical SAM superfamily enzyme YgiQ (UPF0313 family)